MGEPRLLRTRIRRCVMRQTLRSVVVEPPATVDRARIERQMRDLALEHPAGSRRVAASLWRDMASGRRPADES
jgi:hypothetical protein